MIKRIRNVMPSNLIDEDAEPVMDVVLPDTDEKLRAEGWRLHVYREYAEDNVFIASERVLPEKVADPRANRVLDSRRILLHPDEVAWLHARLGELLGDPALRSQLATVERERDEARHYRNKHEDALQLAALEQENGRMRKVYEAATLDREELISLKHFYGNYPHGDRRFCVFCIKAKAVIERLCDAYDDTALATTKKDGQA